MKAIGLVALLVVSIAASAHAAVSCAGNGDCETGQFCRICTDGSSPSVCRALRKEGMACGKTTGACPTTLRCAAGLTCANKVCVRKSTTTKATTTPTTKATTTTTTTTKATTTTTTKATTTASTTTTTQAPGTPCTQPSHVMVDGVCKKYAWMAGPTIPQAIAETSAAVVDDILITFGDGQLELDTNKWTFAFNIKTNKWENPGPFGFNRARRPYPGDHTAVEVFQGKLYAFAGLCCQTYCHGECDADSKTQIYDPAKNVWTKGATVPWFVDGSLSSALINGKIHLCGGVIFEASMALKTCGIYDPATNTWSSMPSLLFATHHTAAGTDGKKFYVIGGREGGNGLSDGLPYTQIYDPAKNKWSLGAPMPTPRTGMGHAAYLGGEFYCIGGETFNKQAVGATSKGVFKLVEIYNPVTNTWRRGEDMPYGMHGVYPIAYNGSIYVAGGAPQIDRNPSTNFLIYRPFNAL